MRRRTVGFHQNRPLASGLLYGALICFTVAMGVGIWDFVGLFRTQTQQAMIQVFLQQEIRTWDAIRVWYLIHSSVTSFTVVAAWVLGIPLLMALIPGRQDRAMTILSQAIQILRIVLRIVRVILIVVFVYKFVRYSVSCIEINGGSFLFFGMVLFEGFLFTMVMLGFHWMIRFLEAACDSVCTIRYTILSGNLDPRGIVPGTVSGLYIAAAVHLILAYLYRWNTAMSVLEWAMAGGYLMLVLWLQRYKSNMEWKALKGTEWIPADDNTGESAHNI